MTSPVNNNKLNSNEIIKESYDCKLIKEYPMDIQRIIGRYFNPQLISPNKLPDDVKQIFTTSEKGVQIYHSKFYELMNFLGDNDSERNRQMSSWIEDLEKNTLFSVYEKVCAHNENSPVAEMVEGFAKKIKPTIPAYMEKIINAEIFKTATKKEYYSQKILLPKTAQEKQLKQKVIQYHKEHLDLSTYEKIKKDAEKKVYQQSLVEEFHAAYPDLQKRLEILHNELHHTRSLNELLSKPIDQFNPISLFYNNLLEITSTDEAITTITSLKNYLSLQTGTDLKKYPLHTSSIIWLVGLLLSSFTFEKEQLGFTFESEMLGQVLVDIFASIPLSNFLITFPNKAVLLINALQKQQKYEGISAEQLGIALKLAISPKLEKVQEILMQHPNFSKLEGDNLLKLITAAIEVGNNKVLAKLANHPNLQSAIDLDESQDMINAFCRNDGLNERVNSFLQYIPFEKIQLESEQIHVMFKQIATSGNLFMFDKLRNHPNFEDYQKFIESDPYKVYILCCFFYDLNKNCKTRGPQVLEKLLELLPKNYTDFDDFKNLLQDMHKEKDILFLKVMLRLLLTHEDKLSDDLKSYVHTVAKEINFNSSFNDNEEKKS